MLLFLVTPFLVVAVQPCMVEILAEKKNTHTQIQLIIQNATILKIKLFLESLLVRVNFNEANDNGRTELTK